MKAKVFVEIPMGSKYKYEDGVIDRILNQKIPYNYGYIPGTLAPDGDALDIFICSTEPINPSTLCNVNIVGGFKCLDNGIQDDKLIGILEGENIYINEYSIQQYLSTYKENFEVLGDLTEEEIRRMVNPTVAEQVIDAYKDYDWSKIGLDDKTSGELKTEKAYEQIALTQALNKEIENLGMGLKGDKK